MKQLHWVPVGPKTIEAKTTKDTYRVSWDNLAEGEYQYMLICNNFTGTFPTMKAAAHHAEKLNAA